MGLLELAKGLDGDLDVCVELVARLHSAVGRKIAFDHGVNHLSTVPRKGGLCAPALGGQLHAPDEP